MRKKSFVKTLLRKLQKLFFAEQWSLLVCDSGGAVLKHIVPPAGRIWADPFPVEHEGRVYIFVEQQFDRKNGTLGYIELFPDLSHSDFMPILEKPYHLSYPNIFRVDSVWYMIPETHENASIDLYRCVSFPDTWVFDTMLIPGITAVDTTVVFHGGKYWLFTSSAEAGRGLNQSLSVFYSDAFPSKHWAPHPMNPVVSGPGKSRMAGSIMPEGQTGAMLRPSQNCVREYGASIVMNRILELSETVYKEEFVREIMPEKNLHAVCTHTWNRCGPYIVRDIKTRKLRL